MVVDPSKLTIWPYLQMALQRLRPPFNSDVTQDWWDQSMTSSFRPGPVWASSSPAMTSPGTMTGSDFGEVPNTLHMVKVKVPRSIGKTKV